MLRFAILGTGFMAETHARCFSSIEGANEGANEGAKLTAVVSRSPRRGRAFAEKYGIRWYEDNESMLKDDIADAVDVCLPTFLHESAVVQAAEFGRHVFCEKPVTLTQDSLNRMLRAVADAGVYFAVGQVVRFWSENRAAARMYERGEFGGIRTIYASRLAAHPRWSDWYEDPELSGGGLFDLHLHDVDYLCHTFGKVESVYARGIRNERGCWNHVTSTLNFSGGFSGVTESSIEMPVSYPLSTFLRIAGERKTVECRMRAGKNLENLDAAIRESVEYRGDGTHGPLDIELKDAYREQLSHFAECVITNRPVEMLSVRSIREAFGVILAVKESLETGKVVSP